MKISFGAMALVFGVSVPVSSQSSHAQGPGEPEGRSVAVASSLSQVGWVGPMAARQDPERPQEPFRPWTGTEDQADWIKLVSGEWLRGKFEALRDGSVEFESDELDDLVLDWDDILEVRIPDSRVVVLDDGTTYSGNIRVIDGVVTVDGETPGRTDKAEVLSIVDTADGADWSGKLTLGLTQRSGNTNQTDASAYGFLRRETASTRWDTSYYGAFSKLESEETANNHRLQSRLDWFWSKRFFVTPAGIDLFRDPFQNIALRATPYVAVGYDFIDAGDVSWSVSAGPAYQYTRYDQVGAGEVETNESAAAYVQSRFDWDVTPDVEFTFDYDITVPLPDSQDYNHHAIATLSLDLIGDFDVDVSVVWDRINSPSADPLGVIPEKDDFRTMVGLSYEF
jgi:hypothetical protein